MLSIVIPFYNDSGCPAIFINQLKNALEEINYELILVDDCSTDDTPHELDLLKSKNVKIIHNAKNKDYGGAITTGLNEANGEIVGFTCGDGEVSADDIVKVYKNMGNCEVIKAIRHDRQDGIGRKFISMIFNVWSKFRFGITIRDINGYPLFMKREVYENISNLRTDWIFNIDMLRKIIKNGHEVKGFSVLHRERTKGKSHITFFRIIKMVWRFVKYK